MAEDNAASHQKCTEKFIDLANAMSEEGMSRELVSAALMSASGLYATYTAAGNEGGLNPSGVEKVVTAYERSLKHIQEVKNKQAGRV